MDHNSEEPLNQEESAGMLAILEGLLKTGLITLLNIHRIEIEQQSIDGIVLSGILKGIMLNLL